jgi:hypothetical protein
MGAKQLEEDVQAEQPSRADKRDQDHGERPFEHSEGEHAA